MPVARKLCKWDYGVFTRRSCVRTLHRYRLLLFAKNLAVSYDRKHQKKYLDIGNIVCDKLSSDNVTTEFESLPIFVSASAITEGYRCKSSVFSLVPSFCALGGCSLNGTAYSVVCILVYMIQCGVITVAESFKM